MVMELINFTNDETNKTEEINNDFIIETLKNIVSRVHTHPSRKKLRLHGSYVSMACPYCGDSAKDNNAKRGTYYLDTGTYVCFNEGCRSNFTKLCDDFGQELSPDVRLEFIKKIDHTKYTNYVSKKTLDIQDTDFLLPLEKTLELLSNDNDWIIGIKKCTVDTNGGKYLLSRSISPDNVLLYEGFVIEYQKYVPVIIILNIFGDKLCSLQIRFLDNRKNRYKFYPYSEVKKRLFPELEIPSEIEKSYDRLSFFMGLGKVDAGKVITIFEGYLDSTLCPNAIGLIGEGVDASILEEFGFEIRYFLDKDKRGIKGSLNRLSKDKKVFLWDKLFNDILSKSSNPLVLKNKLEKIKDLNNLEQHVKGCWKKLNLDNYFSTDEFDILFI